MKRAGFEEYRVTYLHGQTRAVRAPYTAPHTMPQLLTIYYSNLSIIYKSFYFTFHWLLYLRGTFLLLSIGFSVRSFHILFSFSAAAAAAAVRPLQERLLTTRRVGATRSDVTENLSIPNNACPYRPRYRETRFEMLGAVEKQSQRL